MFYTFEGSLAQVRNQFGTMRSIAQQMGEQLFTPSPGVSGWSAGEHLDHVAKVAGGILHILLKDEPVDHRSITAIGWVVLAVDWIPRGKARSPERLQGAVSTVAGLESLFARGEELASQLAGRPPRERRRPLVRHPVFGGLTAAQSVRFLATHNRHHFKIMRDVSQALGRTLRAP